MATFLLITLHMIYDKKRKIDQQFLLPIISLIEWKIQHNLYMASGELYFSHLLASCGVVLQNANLRTKKLPVKMVRLYRIHILRV